MRSGCGCGFTPLHLGGANPVAGHVTVVPGIFGMLGIFGRRHFLHASHFGDSSHHQDYSIFCRVPINLVTVTGRRVDRNCMKLL